MAQHPQIRALSDELAALRAELDDQGAELAGLRQSARSESVSRRHLLRGLAGLGVAGAAGVAAAQPAAAADGENLVLGQQNDASHTTTLAAANSTSSPVLELNSTYGSGLDVVTTDIGVRAEGFIGLRGFGEFAGVTGHGTGPHGIGVVGVAEGAGAAAALESTSGPALWVSTDTGVHLVLSPATTVGPPATEQPLGAVFIDAASDLWWQTSEGAWTRLLREDTAAGRVIPVAPTRVLDTRATGGRPNGSPAVPGQKKGPLTGGTSITLDLAGVGAIPPNARGVVGNLTVAAPTYNGYLSVRPSGAAATATSAVNFAARTPAVANGFTCLLGPDGLTTSSSGGPSNSYQLIVDITAYIT